MNVSKNSRMGVQRSRCGTRLSHSHAVKGHSPGAACCAAFIRRRASVKFRTTTAHVLNSLTITTRALRRHHLLATSAPSRQNLFPDFALPHLNTRYLLARLFGAGAHPSSAISGRTPISCWRDRTSIMALLFVYYRRRRVPISFHYKTVITAFRGAMNKSVLGS